MHKVLAGCTLLALSAVLSLAPSAGAAQTREVLFVGNNWDGTADIVDPVKFTRIARLNIIPDKEERLAEIRMDPVSQGYFLGIRELVGEGNDQFVDDMFSSHDGRFVYVSRPSFADVIGMEIATGKIVWRTRIAGYRSDHMAISPDGTRLLVSASTARKVQEIDTRTGRITGEFESGDQPHENNYSADGTKVFHASIGGVFTPLDQPFFDTSKGDRWFQVVDTRTMKVLERLDMGKKLEEAGYPGMSSAVRPMALAPDERQVYFQVSFFHGFVEYDFDQDRVLRIANLPISDEAAKTPREGYLLDSAHHGLAMNPEGTKLCVAGTMSDYAAIVDRDDFETTIASNGLKPYWSTNSGDGKLCFVSYSGDDRVAVVSYASEKEIASIPVGDHPQRMRVGRVRAAALSAAQGKRQPRLRVRLRPRRVEVRDPVRVRATVTKRRGGKTVRVRGARVHLAGARATTNRRGVAVLRKRYGFESIRRYRATAFKRGHANGHGRLRSVRDR